MWHQGLCSGIEMAVNCLWPRSDILLHTGICYKLFASQMLVKGSVEMEREWTV